MANEPTFAERRRQQNKDRIYTMLCAYIAEHQYPPTTRELAELTGIKSTSSVNNYLSQMREDGVIDYEPCKPRTLRVLV